MIKLLDMAVKLVKYDFKLTLKLGLPHPQQINHLRYATLAGYFISAEIKSQCFVVEEVSVTELT